MNNVFFRGGRLFSLLTVLALVAVSGAAQAKLVHALDWDGDGKADFAILRPSNNIWYIQESGGGAAYQTFGLAGEDFQVPGDYDGDGKADIAIWRDTTATFWELNSSDSTVGVLQWGQPGDEPVNRDYDGDGKTDIAVAQRRNGLLIWHIFRSSDYGYMDVQWGLATDYVAPGDYDGDGKFDLAVQRPGSTPTSQAYFYILRSSDLGLSVGPWGLTGDMVVPGDYDGDGKTDPAVVREGADDTAPLTWWVRRSSDGQAMALQLGVASTDLTVQNDYDGDGKCDFAIWRDPDAYFMYYSSKTGQIVYDSWGQSGDTPLAGYDSH